MGNTKDSSNTVIQLADGWLQFKVPVPFSLRWVNSYLLPEEEGWTLLDPGLHTPEAESFWLKALADNSIAWEHLKTIVVTHHHPDHYGLAGWFQERTGAPVYMSEIAYRTAQRLWGEDEIYCDELTEAFLRNGMLPELEADMRGNLLGFRTQVSPQPQNVRFLQAGTVFPMGGVSWEVIGGEGHAPSHLSFYHAESGRMICADQVLPDISPNVGWMPGGDPNPLGSYLRSLRGLLPLPVTMSFPGHRAPFAEFNKRLFELLDHHERRLQQMLEFIGDKTVNAFEVCEMVFGSRFRNNPHQLRFALAETIAHILYLERRGDVMRIDGDPAPNGQSLIAYRRNS